MTSSLPVNPKAIYGRSKPSLSLLPSGAEIPIARVLELGAVKYGPFNWRKDPVEAETYISAARRHMASWFDGETKDVESGESHLAHVAACMMILLDAEACGTLIDNRPHKGQAGRLITERTREVPCVFPLDQQSTIAHSPPSDTEIGVQERDYRHSFSGCFPYD